MLVCLSGAFHHQGCCFVVCAVLGPPWHSFASPHPMLLSPPNPPPHLIQRHACLLLGLNLLFCGRGQILQWETAQLARGTSASCGSKDGGVSGPTARGEAAAAAGIAAPAGATVRSREQPAHADDATAGPGNLSLGKRACVKFTSQSSHREGQAFSPGLSC